MTTFLAQVSYTGDGSTTAYSITFPFIDSTHVKAFINGVETTAFTISSSTLTFTSAPANSATIRIERQTPITGRLVDFTDGSVLTESDLDEKIEKNDKDYVFLHFILNYLPRGLIGLLIAVIICAAMSSTASELNALAATTTVDLYKRNLNVKKSEKHFLKMSKFFTITWGLIAISFASIGNLFENLIQLVNIIGSIFYGTILGIFLVAFFIKKITANSVFWAACISQIIIFFIYFKIDISYLWLNFIGAVVTISRLNSRSIRS